MEKYYLIAGIAAILFSFFTGFKARQAKGKAMVNDFSVEFGGGSFFGTIWAKLMYLFWWIVTFACVATGLLLLGEFSKTA